ncbi:MAG: S8 family serine peptidase [Chloroflexota bacterium]
MAARRGNDGQLRRSAPWRRRGGDAPRAAALLVLTTAALTVPLTAIADNHDRDAYVETSLLANAQRNPSALFRVIVQGDDGADTASVAGEVTSRLDDNGTSGDRLTGRFASITGVAATLTGKQVLELADDGSIEAITRDVPMAPAAAADAQPTLSPATWLEETGILATLPATLFSRSAPPAIAIVDSGVEPRGLYERRLVAQVNLTQLSPNSPGDGRGHGTFVAGLAASAAPTTRLLSLDVMDDAGRAMTSDVIAAADWILANKDGYRIRVANFSLHAARPSSFRTDPLNRAVERLWNGGVVVVTSAGNYGTGTGPSGVPLSPANDPFVITVGAADLGLRPGGGDDSNAPWSAYGRTSDGFLKPELGAPGRKLLGLAPAASTMALEHPERVVGGLMRMSGTSFAAPIVAGAAAQLLIAHPGWTPDDVKGALMVTARPAELADRYSLGAGLINARAAIRVARPPNPNRALLRFLIDDPAGGPVPVFDAASWDSASRSDASWDSASWADASWADASWADVSWTDASWADASWADASWADASWAD